MWPRVVHVSGSFLFLMTISSAQNLIRFDKIESENDIIPHTLRKFNPSPSPVIQHKSVPRQSSHSKLQLQSELQNHQTEAQQRHEPRKKNLTENLSSRIHQSESLNPAIITLSTDHNVQPRQIQTTQGGKTLTSNTPVVASAASLHYQQQQYNHNGFGGGNTYLPPNVVNPGFPGWNAGNGGCSTCSTYDYSYRQRCCTFGHTVCCTVNSILPIRPTPHTNSYNGGYSDAFGTHGNFGGGVGGYQQYNYQSGYGNGWNNRERPGTCYRPHYQNHIFGNNAFGFQNNHNAGYYFQRADTDIDRDFSTSGYNNNQHSGYNNNQHSGYNNNQHSGGYGIPTPYYSGGGGYGGGGGGGGYGSQGWNGFRPHQPWHQSYCRKDYDCPGNQKCCGSSCTTPSFIG